ncbi:response regulator transcription factor [Microbulbifer sp. CNSA002]|uniref:response regulator transcription factor n=1 Tax=Microbulbifer sp. CNSA002 TaxID=3373604 RepID=UPI0039B69E1F
MSLTALLIEDNTDIARQVCDFLEQQLFQVDYASSGKMGYSLFQQHQYDVVLLDLMLPDIDGIKLCRQIKTNYEVNTPVLMLTARDSIYDKGIGFEAGADDYLTKPFSLEEVAMRCKALYRRHNLYRSQILNIGELCIDIRQHKATRRGQTLKLSRTDFKLLLLLAKAFPQAMTRSELLSRIWGDNFPDSDVLRSHIYILRSILDKPFSYNMLKNIHGVGYKLDVPYE